MRANVKSIRGMPRNKSSIPASQIRPLPRSMGKDRLRRTGIPFSSSERTIKGGFAMAS
jgi:hypothetical protein